MPSQFKQDNPGCDCCGDCESCEAVITQLMISGLTSATHCEETCEDCNGTYLFRTSPWTGGPCTRLTSQNTGFCAPVPAVGEDRYALNVLCNSGSGQWDLSVSISYSGGVYTAEVGITVGYTFSTDYNGSFYGTEIYSRYSAIWRRTGASCADLAGTLTLFSSGNDPCSGSDPGDTGDVCGLFGATIELS